MEQALHSAPGDLASTSTPFSTRGQPDAGPAPGPADAGVLFLDAVRAREEGRQDLARSLLHRALALEPGHRPSNYLMGHFLAKDESYERACEHLRAACTGLPHFIPARHELSEALIALKRWPEALSFSEETVAIAPSADAHFYRGAVLAKLQRFEEAIHAYDEALAIDPTHVGAHYNRAHTLFWNWKLLAPAEENLLASLAGFQRLVELQPDMARAHRSLGFVLAKLDRLDDAIASLDRSIALDPSDMGARHILADTLIANGDWDRGWAEFEHRFAGDDNDFKPALKKSMAELARLYERQPLPQHQGEPGWTGEPLAGKSILLLSEGGFGDIIQFFRFAPLVERMAARVEVAMPSTMRPLLAPGEEPPDVNAHYDFRCSLMSLPMALKIRLDEIPGTPGYLKADPARVRLWSERLGPRRRLRVGIAWSGLPLHSNDVNRSMRLRDIQPLFAADADFICLQKAVYDIDPFALATGQPSYHGDQLEDFADTAALCELMDVVVAVDTSIAHLAGALGKPVWIMLPRAAEWRWMVGREDSPWYDSARLFRQQRQGEWAPVVQRVLDELRLRIGSEASA